MTLALVKSELTNQHISRQLDIVPPDILHNQINIIGAGAIGSWTALCLGKMGFKNIAIFDHDNVDIVNMSSQFYRHEDIHKHKASTLAESINQFTGGDVSPIAIDDKWSGMKLRGLVVMAVDSMEVRKSIYEAHKGNIQTNWLIDARMGAETALLYTVNPNSAHDQGFYEKTLYSDEEAVQERCTAKSTTYCSLVLSGLVAKTVRDVLVRHKYMRNMTFSLKESDFLAFCTDLRPQS